jgi:hypothetical protein
LEIEKKPVTSAEQAVELSENFQGDRVLLRVWSRGASRFLFVNIERESDKEKQEKEEK